MLSILAAVVLLQASASPDPDLGPRVVTPAWRRTPTAGDLEQVFPAHAARAGINGQSTLRCEVTAEGTLTKCIVVAESPLGEGMGDA